MIEGRPVHHRGLDRLVERQMRNWELARSQQRETSQPSAPRMPAFITISRTVAAGGEEIARRLAERLELPLFDRELLRFMAQDDDVRARIYASMDERDMGWFEEVFRSVAQTEFRKNDYLHRLSDVVLRLARQAPAIFLGRAADLILPRGHGLRVGLVAPLETRVRRYAEKAGITASEARESVERIDNERTAWVRRHFNVDLASPERHDLIINTDGFSAEHATDLIVQAWEMKARDEPDGH